MTSVDPLESIFRDAPSKESLQLVLKEIFDDILDNGDLDTLRCILDGFGMNGLRQMAEVCETCGYLRKNELMGLAAVCDAAAASPIMATGD